jgi:hypothetical protein
MPRPIRQDDSGAPGQDSFLDTVTNVVGIMIILVMVVGVRVRNAPVEMEGPDAVTRAEMTGLEQDRATVASLQGDVLRVAEKVETVQRERLARHEERIALATAVSAVKHDLDVRRQDLDAGERKDFDLRRALAESQADLDRLGRERERARHVQAAPITVENYPTPMSKPVDSNEAHFQLSGGRLAFVPMQDLLEEFKIDARGKAENLRSLPELTETIGPIAGFRISYTLERRQVALENSRRTGVVGTYAALKSLSVIPVDSRMGEPLDRALAEGSEFRRALARFRPGRSTVTIWTYPDSFDEFRRLKKVLHQAGYETAGRPLPFGIPISASPEGSRSAAQ